VVEQREGVSAGTRDQARSQDSTDGVLPETYQLPCKQVSDSPSQLTTIADKQQGYTSGSNNNFRQCSSRCTRRHTHTTETKQQHALEKQEKDLATVHVLELWLGIVTRLVLGCPECEEARRLVSMWKYQWCLDHLKGLVVAHIFKLMKMNRSQTS
jgi:hypothetical protein